MIPEIPDTGEDWPFQTWPDPRRAMPPIGTASGGKPAAPWGKADSTDALAKLIGGQA